MARLVHRHHVRARFTLAPFLNEIGQRLFNDGLDLPALASRQLSHAGENLGIDLGANFSRRDDDI